MTMPIYIDIDGTLTDDPNFAAGRIKGKRVDKIKHLLTSGIPIVIWSAGGGNYARRFVEMNGLTRYGDIIGLGKPRFCVDDCESIRPDLIVRPPEWLDRE